MDFETAYKQADTILKRWGAKGVEEAGEAESDWIFKGYATKGIASEAIILIDRSNGEIRIFNAGRRRDRDVTRTAKKNKDINIKIRHWVSGAFIEYREK